VQLSSEDSLRINVLLANKPTAIRINESSMILFGLMPDGDAQVKLNPNCRDEQYVKRVKEVLSSHISGSPGGYPIFIQRWTRMGQMRDDSLEQLLLLGETEAVVAVTCANGLTDEIARRAWWAMEDPENARRMLGHEEVVTGEMGRVLANYLIEYLPFETEPEIMIESIRLVLQPGLTDIEVQQNLWKKGGRKSAYHVGFLLSVPNDLPIESNEHHLFSLLKNDLELMVDSNPYANVILQLLSTKGQAFLHAFENILKKPSNQEVVNMALDAVRYYFADLRSDGDPDLTIDELKEEAESFIKTDNKAFNEIIALDDRLLILMKSLRIMSGLGYGVLRPAFHNTTAIGSLMRKKLEPIFEPLREEIKILTS